MEGPSRPRESRPRPPRTERESERPRDRPRGAAGPRSAGRERDRARVRDPRHDGARPGEPRAGEQSAGGRARDGRARNAPPGTSRDAARQPPRTSRDAAQQPPRTSRDAARHPRAAPGEPLGPPPAWREDFWRRRPDSAFTSESYLPPYPGPGREDMDYYQSESQGLLDCHKCRYLCTGRGVVQIVEVILNGMVLMCIVASYFVLAGFSASFSSGGGFGNNYYSPFEGTELEQVRQLDQQYTVLRSPLIYGGVAVSLGLGVLTMGVLLQGAKSLSRLPPKWLFLEAAFSLLAAAGYCVGIGFYLHGALRINATDTCKARERLYARKGLTWMNCQLAGTDGAAATFACLLVLMYGASMVLALRSSREQKHLCKDNRSMHTSHGHAPEYLWSGTL